MKTRILKNWRTSLIGFGALVVGTIALFLGKVSGAEYVGICSFAATYIVAKDSLLEGVTGGAIKIGEKPQ
jgi:hypothetical protein